MIVRQLSGKEKSIDRPRSRPWSAARVASVAGLLGMLGLGALAVRDARRRRRRSPP